MSALDTGDIVLCRDGDIATLVRIPLHNQLVAVGANKKQVNIQGAHVKQVRGIRPSWQQVWRDGKPRNATIQWIKWYLGYSSLLSDIVHDTNTALVEA